MLLLRVRFLSPPFYHASLTSLFHLNVPHSTLYSCCRNFYFCNHISNFPPPSLFACCCVFSYCFCSFSFVGRLFLNTFFSIHIYTAREGSDRSSVITWRTVFILKYPGRTQPLYGPEPLAVFTLLW